MDDSEIDQLHELAAAALPQAAGVPAGWLTDLRRGDPWRPFASSVWWPDGDLAAGVATNDHADVDGRALAAFWAYANPHRILQLLDRLKFGAAVADARLVAINDGELIVLRMPDGADVEAFFFNANDLVRRLAAGGAKVHVIVLEHDTELAEVDDDVMAQAGWERVDDV